MTLFWDSEESRTEPYGEVTFDDFGLVKSDVLSSIVSHIKNSPDVFYTQYEISFLSIEVHFNTGLPHLTLSLFPYFEDNYSFKYVENLLSALAEELSSRHGTGFVLSLSLVH
jgi:hypothetical protein